MEAAMTMGIRTGCALAIAGALWATAGCGGAAPPTSTQTDAVAAVRSAETLGSDQTPAAAYQLELARGELQQADGLIHHGQMDEARRLLERAKADAQLAIALRREDQARSAAMETHEHIDQMRDVELGTSGAEATAPTTPGAEGTAETQTTTTTTVTTTAQPE
jgi:hypothetical protein